MLRYFRHTRIGRSMILAALITGMATSSLTGCGGKPAVPEAASTAAVSSETASNESTAAAETGGKKLEIIAKESVEEESVSEDAVQETEATGDETDDDFGPRPGELEPAIEGGYGAGRVVVFSEASFISQPEGIYRLEAGTDEPELLVGMEMRTASEICTDGWMLYYCDPYGRVMELDLQKKGAEPVQVSADGFAAPAGSGVVGVNHHSVYVQVNNFGISEEEEDYYTGGLPDVIRINKESGQQDEIWEGCFGGCRGGLTYVMQDGFDVSPRLLRIFDFQDSEIVNEPGAWSVNESQGTLWYSREESDPEFAGAILYKVNVDEAEEVLRCEEEDGYFGITVGGFLACIHYYTEGGDDSEPDAGTNYVDLRSMQPIGEERRSFTGQAPMYWGCGYTRKGVDYLTEYSRICRVDEDGLTDVFDLPADVYADGFYLTDDYVIIPDIEDRVLFFDLDHESDVHPIPVTAFTQRRRQVGTEGLLVTEYYPQLMTEGAYHWPALCSALDRYNALAEARVRVNAEDCYEIAESLAESGIFDDYEDPALKSVVNAYIQRADTLCFSLMDHEYTDPVVGPKNYEVKTGYNFAPEDGHEIGLEEVITDLNALAEIMITHLEEQFPNERLSYSPADFVDELLSRRNLRSTKEFSWVLGYEGVSFYFNGTVNFPFTRGSWKYYVAFSEHPEIFDKKWFNVPDDYAYDVIVDDYFAEDYQLESEEGVETVLFTADKLRDEQGYPQNTLDALEVWISPTRMFEMREGDAVRVGIWSDTLKGMILHEGNDKGGKNYLLLQYNGDSMELETFAIEGGFRSIGSYPLSALPQCCPENGVDAVGTYVTHVWLSDPNHFTVMEPGEEHPELGYTQRSFRRLEEGKIVAR